MADSARRDAAPLGRTDPGASPSSSRARWISPAGLTPDATLVVSLESPGQPTGPVIEGGKLSKSLRSPESVERIGRISIASRWRGDLCRHSWLRPRVVLGAGSLCIVAIAFVWLIERSFNRSIVSGQTDLSLAKA